MYLHSSTIHSCPWQGVGPSINLRPYATRGGAHHLSSHLASQHRPSPSQSPRGTPQQGTTPQQCQAELLHRHPRFTVRGFNFFFCLDSNCFILVSMENTGSTSPSPELPMPGLACTEPKSAPMHMPSWKHHMLIKHLPHYHIYWLAIARRRSRSSAMESLTPLPLGSEIHGFSLPMTLFVVRITYCP